MILGSDSIRWVSSLDSSQYVLCLIISAVSGLIIGFAGKPAAWLAILLSYIGLPIGIAISSIIYAIEQDMSTKGVLEAPIVAAMFYIGIPIFNLFFTWSFMLSLLIVRAGKQIVKRFFR